VKNRTGSKAILRFEMFNEKEVHTTMQHTA